MKNRNGASRRVLKYVEQTKATDELAPLLHRWLDLFETCIREEDYETGQSLFHKNTTGFWFGSREINLADLAIAFKEVTCDWSDLHQFAIDTANATIIPCERTFVIAVPWTSKSRIMLARDKTGLATFVLRFFEKRLLCLHVHFS